MDHQVEAVARAFFDVEEDARGWDDVPEELKELFRRDARAAIALLGVSQAEASSELFSPAGAFDMHPRTNLSNAA